MNESPGNAGTARPRRRDPRPLTSTAVGALVPILVLALIAATAVLVVAAAPFASPHQPPPSNRPAKPATAPDTEAHAAVRDAFVELAGLWRELEQKHPKCHRLRPLKPAGPAVEIDRLAQLAGAKPVTDPMIRCWGVWSREWNGRVRIIQDEMERRAVPPLTDDDAVWSAELSRAASDLHLYWREHNRIMEGRGADPARARRRLVEGLVRVRDHFAAEGESTGTYEDLFGER